MLFFPYRPAVGRVTKYLENTMNAVKSTSTLIAHCGSRIVPREVIERVPVPPATKTWFPVGHAQVLDGVESRVQAAGFAIQKAQYALSQRDGQFFGTLDLRSGLADGVTLSVGIRNSIDKTLPLGFCAGSRVLVCDNLSFGADLIVKRKHTKFGDERFGEAISQAIKALEQFQAIETIRIAQLKIAEVGAAAAESFLLRTWEDGILTNHSLPLVLKEWRKPSFREFEPRTGWSLFNAFTTVLGRMKMSPQLLAERTIQLTGMVNAEFRTPSMLPMAA
jgi:hypothetical protein